MISFERTTNNASRPAFIVDQHSIMRDTGRQIDWDAIVDGRYDYQAAKVTLTAAVTATDTEVSVEPLTKPLRVGQLLDFGEDAGEALVLRVTAVAAVGDETITVEEADEDIPDGSVAYYGGSVGATGGGKHIPAGTVMDLLPSGMVVPSALNTGGATAFGLLATNADEDSRTDAATGYGMIKSGSIYENLLPEADGADPSVISSDWKTELLARGGFWMFEQYEDNT